MRLIKIFQIFEKSSAYSGYESHKFAWSWCQLPSASQGPGRHRAGAVITVWPGRFSPEEFLHCPFSLLSSDLWTNVSVVKPGPRSSDEMGTCVCVFVYPSTSCWIGVTSPHWDLIYYLTAICACVCALVNALSLCVSEAWCATWQRPPPLHLPTHTLSTLVHTKYVHSYTHKESSRRTFLLQCSK